jgi:hypothetical protein
VGRRVAAAKRLELRGGGATGGGRGFGQGGGAVSEGPGGAAGPGSPQPRSNAPGQTSPAVRACPAAGPAAARPAARPTRPGRGGGGGVRRAASNAFPHSASPWRVLPVRASPPPPGPPRTSSCTLGQRGRHAASVGSTAALQPTTDSSAWLQMYLRGAFECRLSAFKARPAHDPTLRLPGPAPKHRGGAAPAGPSVFQKASPQALVQRLTPRRRAPGCRTAARSSCCMRAPRRPAVSTLGGEGGGKGGGDGGRGEEWSGQVGAWPRAGHSCLQETHHDPCPPSPSPHPNPPTPTPTPAPSPLQLME